MASQQRQIRDQILIEPSKPLTVAILGQTGVGKSLLMNALFGSGLRIGDIRDPKSRASKTKDCTGQTRSVQLRITAQCVRAWQRCARR
jgi:predicted GTPase